MWVIPGPWNIEIAFKPTSVEPLLPPGQIPAYAPGKFIIKNSNRNRFLKYNRGGGEDLSFLG